DSLLGVIQDFGKDIFDAFSNPKQLIKDLGNAIKQNVINRFQALAKIAQRVMNFDFDGIGDDFIQAGTGVENLTGKVSKLGKETGNFLNDAYQRGLDIEKLQQDLSASEADFIKSQAELNREYEEQRAIMEDM